MSRVIFAFLFALTDIQLAGKKRMPVAEFLKGFRDPEDWHANTSSPCPSTS